MAIGINPNPVQAIIGGSGSSTNKLRHLVSFVGIAWRHARGNNQPMRNAEIRAALAPFIAGDVLAQLSETTKGDRISLDFPGPGRSRYPLSPIQRQKAP